MYVRGFFFFLFSRRNVKCYFLLDVFPLLLKSQEGLLALLKAFKIAIVLLCCCEIGIFQFGYVPKVH